MFWIAIIALINFSAVIFYHFRYISKIKFLGLYIVQFYQLLIVTPLAFVALINLALDITATPSIGIISINERLLFSLFSFSLASTIIGVGIHSASTSVYQSFSPNLDIKAYIENEIFHGPFSHDLVFIGANYTAFFLFLLGLNHPTNINQDLILPTLLGLAIGIPAAIAVIRGTHLILVAINSLICSVVGLLIFVNFNLVYYPVSFSMLLAFTSFSLTLLLALLIYFTSKRVTKLMIKLLFPKGHPIYEKFHFF